MELKVYKNNSNNQLYIPLSRKKLNIGNNDPISIELLKVRLNFLKKKEGNL